MFSFDMFAVFVPQTENSLFLFMNTPYQLDFMRPIFYRLQEYT